MRIILLIIGIVLIVSSLASLIPYVLDYADLSKYGKGFIAGKFFILLVGIALVVVGRRKKVRK